MKVFIKVVSRTNKIIRDHQENYLDINKVTSTCYKFVRNKIKCAINRQYPALYTNELNGGTVHLKSPGSKANQLKHHAILILEELQYDTAAIYVEINNLLKGMPSNVTVVSICNDIL